MARKIGVGDLTDVRVAQEDGWYVPEVFEDGRWCRLYHHSHGTLKRYRSNARALNFYSSWWNWCRLADRPRYITKPI